MPADGTGSATGTARRGTPPRPEGDAVRHGVVILPEHGWARAQECWRLAEELGFEHAWTYDQLMWRWLRDAPWYATIPTLTAAATATATIRLGLLVANPC